MGARALKIFAREGGPTLGRTMLGIRDRDRKTSDFLMQMLERRKELADSSTSKAEIAALKAENAESPREKFRKALAIASANGGKSLDKAQMDAYEALAFQENSNNPLKVGGLLGGKSTGHASDLTVDKNPTWKPVGVANLETPKLIEMVSKNTSPDRIAKLYNTTDETVVAEGRKKVADELLKRGIEEKDYSTWKRKKEESVKTPVGDPYERGGFSWQLWSDGNITNEGRVPKPPKKDKITPAEYNAAIKAAKEEIGDNPTPPRLRVGTASDRKKAAQMTKEWNDKIKKRAAEILSGNVIPSKSGTGDTPDGRPTPAAAPPSKGQKKRKKKNNYDR